MNVQPCRYKYRKAAESFQVCRDLYLYPRIKAVQVLGVSPPLRLWYPIRAFIYNRSTTAVYVTTYNPWTREGTLIILLLFFQEPANLCFVLPHFFRDTTAINILHFLYSTAELCLTSFSFSSSGDLNHTCCVCHAITLQLFPNVMTFCYSVRNGNSPRNYCFNQ